MKLGNLEVTMIEDARRWYKLASIRVTALLAIVYGALIALLPLVADHWPEMAPFLFKFFPGADQAIGPFIGALLTIGARLISIRRHDRDGPNPNS